MILNVFRWNLVVFPKNWSFLDVFVMPYLLWYHRKFKDDPNVDVFNLKKQVDLTVWTWTLDLTKWLFYTSVSGVLVWFVVANLTSFYAGSALLGFPQFFAWGVASWIVVKVRPKWW